MATIIFSFYRQTTGDPEKLRNLPKVIQLVTARLGFEPKLNLHSPSSKNYAAYLSENNSGASCWINDKESACQSAGDSSILYLEDPMCHRTIQPVQHGY